MSQMFTSDKGILINILDEGVIQIGEQGPDCHQFHAFIHLKSIESLKSVRINLKYVSA